jgi:hypothetical protein
MLKEIITTDNESGNTEIDVQIAQRTTLWPTNLYIAVCNLSFDQITMNLNLIHIGTITYSQYKL